jgi:DNA-binding transcriptional LysR family regulator
MKVEPSASRLPGIDFELRHLEIFCKVLELGSFSRAAGKVHLAQASVSERVANLERLVGTRLLDRMGRQVVPTKAGERLYRQAIALLEMKRAVCLDMEGFLGMRRGKISLGGSTIPGEYILPRVLGRFRKRYPDVTLSLEIADTAGVHRGVLEGGFELGVAGYRSTDSRLVHEALWEDELMLAVPADHRWAGREAITLREMRSEPLILREEGSGTQRSLEDHLRGAGGRGTEDLKISARLGTSTAVKEAVKAGLGPAFLSHHALAAELEQGSVKALRLEGPRITRRFHMVRDARRTASPLCEAMWSFLVETARTG